NLPKYWSTKVAEYAIIVPTLNEKGNVKALAKQIQSHLEGIDWELIFVDDNSTDGTLDELYELAANDRRIRFLRRLHGKGLASACIDGMLSTTAAYMAVMDADLQHDASKLPELFTLLRSGEADLAVASRYLPEGSTGDWDSKRTGMSRLATAIAGKWLRVTCSDPMSGFFALTRPVVLANAEKIQSTGFKILFDILLLGGNALRVKEVPYTFKARASGQTKLGVSVLVDFLRLLIARSVGPLINTEFILFCFVGLTGLFVHLAVLYVLHRLMGQSFLAGQSVATLAAMTSNYALNNIITFGDRKLKGKSFVFGYGKFVAACALGALCNIAVADFLESSGLFWILSASAGVVAGAITNFFFAWFFIWKKK
ncbi:glycosyltransferase family 2 protein, partial [Desulfovibrio sp. OttesenSCG-928-F20]|nr:glycosyltransferase family 2 protein [Desulfovibrio sp. OttesenSCG-928-F20]